MSSYLTNTRALYQLWSQYNGNLKWLKHNTIYLTRHGSHAYGTSLPTSDLDIRGICVAPKEYYLGFLNKFEQAVQNEPVDLTVFDIRKLMHLAADANPNALELLFTDPSDHLYCDHIGDHLLGYRRAFLSTKVKHTFSGYSRAQMARIHTHYRWLKNPPKAPPTRAEFGLPERTVIPADQLAAAQAAIQKRVDQWAWHELDSVEPAIRQAIQDEFSKRLLEITQWSEQTVPEHLWKSAALGLGIDTNFIHLLDLERQYNGRMKEWQNYQHWLKTRNPARAELEAQFGYDTKHAMHLVRLARMCREILETGLVNVRRHDAEELLAIRHGTWTYEELVEFSNKQDAELDEVAARSSLPRQPDRTLLDQLCVNLIHMAIR